MTNPCIRRPTRRQNCIEMSAEASVDAATNTTHPSVLPEEVAVFEPLSPPPVPLHRSYTHPGHYQPEDSDMVSEHSVNMESQFLTAQQVPFIAPMPPHSRRERLLRIGTSSAIDRGHAEQPNVTTFLRSSTGNINFYGSVTSSPTTSKFRTISGLPFRGFDSNPPSPHPLLRARSSFFVQNSPIAYDTPLEEEDTGSMEDNDAKRANGIRVW